MPTQTASGSSMPAQQFQQALQVITNWDQNTVTPQLQQAIQYLVQQLEQPQVLQAIEQVIGSSGGRTRSGNMGGNS